MFTFNGTGDSVTWSFCECRGPL